MAHENAIEVAALTRAFGEHQVLAGVDLTLPAGGVYGLLGPNGAGKTTTVRILTGVLRAGTAARLRVLQHDLPGEVAQIRPRIGVQTDTELYERLSATENLTYFGRLYGMDGGSAGRAARALLERFGLGDRASDKVGTFSKGMRQKTLIARALISGPELVFLDEPTAGLDPEAAHELMTYIKDLSCERGTTFFITSHRLEEMESVCTTVGVLTRGRIVSQGAPADVAREIVPEIRLRITTSDGAPLDCAPLVGRPGVLRTAENRDGAVLELDSAARIPSMIREVAAMPRDLLGVAEDPPTLEEAYLRLVADEEGR